MNPSRVRQIHSGSNIEGPIVYWMSRDQRTADNWALLYAQECAITRRQPLAVVFCLVPNYLEAALRQYDFMLKGLQEVEKKLQERNISFHLLQGEPGRVLPEFLRSINASQLVTDFSPLRINRKWLAEVASRVKVPVSQVDAHNIVPCWIASPKLEFAAYTLRPKLRRLLNEYLEEMPKLRKHPIASQEVPNSQWDMIHKFLKIDKSVGIAAEFVPGANAGKKALSNFVEHRLSDYDELRNDPCVDGQSNLSPYLHFGQVSAQRAALESMKRRKNEAFLEELIVRRELADNFCFYMPHYDLFEGFHPWAQKTLNEHRKDKREFLYELDAFESARTHDPLWNACQKEMLSTGKMHGFMRMYWGKKILEWSESPETALTIAIYLNDKYELDGRDPNGYAGIAWSIGGVHDRAWGERNVYGKIRYMNANGCARKFDVKAYVAKFCGPTTRK